MKYVYILEKDPRFLREILEAVAKIDPQLQPRIFQTLESFANWIQLLSKEGKKAIARGGFSPADLESRAAEAVPAEAVPESPDDQLVLLISDNEILGSKHLDLLRKTQTLFISKGVCSNEDPTAIIITAFDNPDFDVQTVEDRIINNVIFKPFDKMILLQHLIFGISGRHPPSTSTLYNMKTTATIEMLKDVEVEAYSDVGFITKGNRAVPVGAVTKYFGEVFTSGKTQTVFARCYKSEPHPTEPGIFQCGFTYFGTEPEQISTFRKNLRDHHDKDFSYSWRGLGDKDKSISVIVIDPEEGGATSLSGTIDRNFLNSKTVGYKSYYDFLIDLDPSEKKKKDKQPAALPIPAGMKFIFDFKTQKIIKIEPELVKGQTIFAFTPEEFAKLDFIDWLPGEQKKIFKQMLKGQPSPPTTDTVVTVENKQYEFFIKFGGYKPTLDDKGITSVELSVVELSDAERTQFLSKNSRMPAQVHMILIDELFARENDLEKLAALSEKLKARGFTGLFCLLSKERKKDAGLRNLGKIFADIFYHPVERNHFVKKLFLFNPDLIPTEEIKIKQMAKAGTIQVGTPIKIEEISEAGLVMRYYRPIATGAFRRFALWVPTEIGLPIILATCNFTKEIEKGVVDNHFVFFGIHDHDLQNVRVWIRDVYINSKKEEAS